MTKYNLVIQSLIACLVGGGIALLVWAVSAMPLAVVGVVAVGFVCLAAWVRT